jgi:signal transduction histidine kinase
MFGCLKSTKQMNTQGIGLGLFICKKIVQEFEGVIFVRSELG